MSNLNRSKHIDVVEQVRDQASQLVVPNLSVLRIVLMERKAELEARDRELAREQDRVASTGMEAAIRLMMPSDMDQERVSQTPPHPYVNALPNKAKD